MKIADRDTAQDVFIIAEAGNNHEGRLDVAERLVQEAARAGADAVKFQTFRTGALVSAADQTRYNRLEAFELTPEQFRHLREVANEAGITFLSTPFDLQSADFLNELVPAIKIASGDNTFFPLLRRVAGFGKPVILSTGISGMEELRLIKSFFDLQWGSEVSERQLALLHCVASYPVKEEDANLGRIGCLKAEFDLTVGYSDHCLGIEAAVLAVAAGADIIEKHFTLDHHFSDFRDHQLSADPVQMVALVERVRQARRLRGRDPAVQADTDAAGPLRRSLAAARRLSAGTLLAKEDMLWIRPGHGIPPRREEELLGRRLKRDVPAGEFIHDQDLDTPAA